MIKTTITGFRDAISRLWGSWTAVAVFAGMYAVLLATVWGFIATREATVSQVFLTLFFLFLIPAEFFILQAAIVTHARLGRIQWGRVLRDSCKLFVVSLPVIAAGWGLFYLLRKWQAHFPIVAALPHPEAQAVKPAPIQTSVLIFDTVRSLAAWVILPLAMIHLWIEVSSDDLRHLFNGGVFGVLRRIGNVLARAVSSGSVLIYTIGLAVFGLVPYALLFMHPKIQGVRTDFSVFILRLVLVYLFSLLGWVITVTALTRFGAPNAVAVAPGKNSELHVVEAA
jgi:hypothetical protein